MGRVGEEEGSGGGEMAAEEAADGGLGVRLLRLRVGS